MYFSNSSKYPHPQELHDKFGIKFWVRHIHVGNDPDGSDRKHLVEDKKHFHDADGNIMLPEYATTCVITDETGDLQVGYGESICGPLDTPNRRMGHEIAVTRAIKDYLTNKKVLDEADRSRV